MNMSEISARLSAFHSGCMARYIVTLVPKAMFAALLVASGLNLLSDHLKTAYTDLQHKEFALVILHIGLTATLGMLSAVVLGKQSTSSGLQCSRAQPSTFHMTAYASLLSAVVVSALSTRSV